MTNKPLNLLQKRILLINVIVRIIVSLPIFIRPITTSFFTFLIDAIDHEYLVRWLHLPRPLYQLQDKILDFYWYILILIYILTQTTNSTLHFIIIATFLLRLIGTISFTLNHKEKNIIVLP